ncbi:MAG: hypothetical protein H6Q25_102 [Bacteroidetes bacterium]|nr:hypothetical protein [Bacteroidota bacterium]
MTIYFQFFEAENLFLQRFVGKWKSNIYEDFILANANQETNKIRKIATDFRELIIPPDLNDLNILRNITKKIELQDYFNIQIVNDPIMTAVAQLYQITDKPQNVNYDICSTLQYAINFLNIDMTPHELEQRFKNLTGKFPNK